jgi:hypothetical protein
MVGSDLAVCWMSYWSFQDSSRMILTPSQNTVAFIHDPGDVAHPIHAEFLRTPRQEKVVTATRSRSEATVELCPAQESGRPRSSS